MTNIPFIAVAVVFAVFMIIVGAAVAKRVPYAYLLVSLLVPLSWVFAVSTAASAGMDLRSFGGDHTIYNPVMRVPALCALLLLAIWSAAVTRREMKA